MPSTPQAGGEVPGVKEEGGLGFTTAPLLMLPFLVC